MIVVGLATSKCRRESGVRAGLCLAVHFEAPTFVAEF